MTSIYQFSANAHHVTSHNIAADTKYEICIDELSMNVQMFAAVNCLAQGLGLRLVSVADRSVP
jgi:hypothetical protein